MDSNFEQNIPLPLIVAVFLVFIILGNILSRRLRKSKLIRQGQLHSQDGKMPTVAERVAGNSAWSSGLILSEGRGMMVGSWFLAVVANLALGAPFITSFKNPAIGNTAVFFLGVLSLVGIAIAVFSARITMRYLRFGQSVCAIDGKAGIVGKKIEGFIRTAVDIRSTGDYKIELQCIETYTTGTGKNRKTESKTEWQASQTVPRTGVNSRAGVPFSIEIPTFVPETGYQLARGDIDWQLKIKAPVQGIDYSAIFVVPVFKV